MPEDNPENNPERKRLIIELEGPSTGIARVGAQITDAVGGITSANNVSVQVHAEDVIRTKPAWTNQTKVTYTPDLNREHGRDASGWISPELFTWVEDPQTGAQVAVITGSNMVAFGAEKMQSSDPEDSVQSRYHRFFSRVTNYYRRHEADNENYVLFDEPKAGRKHLPTLGIRVNSSLELLRRLKTGDIGDYKMTIRQHGIRGVGDVAVGSFEEYLDELFPVVDISLATSDLDLDLLSRMLNRSEKRGTVWSWVVQQEVGTAFNLTGSSRSNLPPRGARPHLINLQALGLIDRRPAAPHSYKPQRYPFIKLQDSRWKDLERLLTERGEMPELQD